MQRARGGGNAVRRDRACSPARRRSGAIAAGGLLLSTSGLFRAQRRTRSTAPGPARRPHAAHDQHEHDRRRPAARGVPDARPKVEALIVYNSNPVAVAPESRARSPRASRARTCLRWCWSTSRRTPPTTPTIVLPADHAARARWTCTSLRPPYLLANNAAIAPLGEALPNTEIFRAAGGGDGLRRAVLSATDDEAIAARRSCERTSTGSSCERARAGLETGRCRRRRSRKGGFPHRIGQVRVYPGDGARRGSIPCRTTCRRTRRRPGARGRAIRWR